MKSRRPVWLIPAAMMWLVVPASSAGAAEIPASPMDFKVEMNQGSAGKEPDCDPPMDQIGQKLMTGGSVELTCQINEKQSNADMSGTVSNPTLAQSDEGFNKGVITQTCDVDQQLEMVMSIGMGTNAMKKFKGKMAQACAWTMEFSDAESSTLSGTMEMNGTMGSDDGSVADNVVTMKMTMKVYMVDGTGIFEGYTGGGEFTRTEDLDMMGGGPGGSGGPTQGGAPSASTPPSGSVPSGGAPTGSTPATGSVPPTGSIPPSQGSVQMPDSVKQFCASKGISPCDQSSVMKYCESNLTACAALSAQRVRSAGLASAVRAFSEGDAMTMQLKKGAGAVRILGPSAPTGQPKAAATVKASTKVEIVATPGAKCTVRTNRNRIVATRTVTSSSLTVLTPRANSYRGASSIQAICKIGKATVKSNIVKVKLG